MDVETENTQAVMARARQTLADILERMGIEAEVDVRDEPDRILLTVRAPESAVIIGKKGQTLDALQYVVARIVYRGTPEGARAPKSIVVDAEGYRDRRAEALIDMAHRLADKAVRSGRPITVDPMSPHDRRIIHLALDKVPGVTTRSEGEGSFRRLLIVPAPDKA